MNRRWGNRITVDLPVRVRHPLAAAERTAHNGTGRLINVSLDGALIGGPSQLTPEARVQISLEGAVGTVPSPSYIEAYIVRNTAAAFAVQWEEFAPPQIVTLVRELGSRSAQNLLARDLATHTRYSRT